MGVYRDFPECLSRYGWLLDRDDLFDRVGVPRCKACGDTVPRDAQLDHREGHKAMMAERVRVARLEALGRAREVRGRRSV